ncbi:hypothetical protein [Demequina sp. NBRC 110051]|uniref:hypothetical protein n=1 Tax=Demequina sp. NBRC 110051 TaxID=1570340 RepID=UPI0011810E61|nr:hypothetical protein [Demequina sp. NBRC 110051]
MEGPRLRPGVPVLERPDGALQVGWRRPVLFHDVSRADRALLGRLSGAGGAANDADHRIVERLRTAGLLARDEVPPLPRVRVHHTGTLGVAIAASAARLGMTVGFAGDTTPMPDGTTRSWWALRALRAAHAPARVLPAEGPCDVDVLVAVGCAPPHAAVLMARDQRHLIVTTDEHGIEVSHVVIPGTTACGTCLALAAVPDDPALPWLAAQLATTAPSAPGRSVITAAALAAHACLHGAGAPQEPKDESDDQPHHGWRISHAGAVTILAASPHPDCRCGAAGEPGDALAARRARFHSR